MTLRQTEITFAVFGIGLGALILGIWIPLDVDTGMIETFRRQTVIGDAFLPVIAGSAILLCSVLHLVQQLLRKGSPGDTFQASSLALSDLMLLGVFFAIITVALLIMYWAGPLLSLLHDEGYRTLRGRIPWKYAGFFLGGATLLTGCISLIEGQLDARTVLIATLCTVVLIALFDLPFGNILLPPNGDW